LKIPHSKDLDFKRDRVGGKLSHLIKRTVGVETCMVEKNFGGQRAALHKKVFWVRLCRTLAVSLRLTVIPT
jgi:hypothetical protein